MFVCFLSKEPSETLALLGLQFWEDNGNDVRFVHSSSLQLWGELF